LRKYTISWLWEQIFNNEGGAICRIGPAIDICYPRRPLKGEISKAVLTIVLSGGFWNTALKLRTAIKEVLHFGLAAQPALRATFTIYSFAFHARAFLQS
jgi:hypothetical protein